MVYFSSEKGRTVVTLILPSKEETTLSTLLQTSPTRARGLWSSVFFSIEVNPSTTCSGPTGYYSLSHLLCSVHDQPVFFGFEFLQQLFLIPVHVPCFSDKVTVA